MIFFYDLKNVIFEDMIFYDFFMIFNEFFMIFYDFFYDFLMIF